MKAKLNDFLDKMHTPAIIFNAIFPCVIPNVCKNAS